MTKTVLKKKDLDSLNGKLEEFAKGLPEQEQNVLGWLLARAQSTPDAELSDSELDTVSGGALANSLGFGNAEDSTISVTWSHKFDSSSEQS